jgi:hypothetical protein
MWTSFYTCVLCAAASRLLSLLWQLHHVSAQSCSATPAPITVTSAADAAVLIKAALCPAATVRAVWQNSVQLPDTIVVANSTSLTIISAEGTVIDGASKMQLFNVFGSLTLANVTLSNGLSDNGGAVYIQPAAKVSMTGCTVRNSSAHFGAALYASSASELTITGSSLLHNTAAAAGGALYSLADSTVILQDVTMAGNSAAATGGAVNVQGSLTADQSTFVDNVSLSRGGAVNGEVTSALLFQNSTFTNNTSQGTYI